MEKETPYLNERETQALEKLLTIAAAQIKVGLFEGDKAINSLTQEFHSIAFLIEKIKGLNESFSSNTIATGGEKNIEDYCELLLSKIQEAIVAIQFYDRLTQRLSHVDEGLLKLARLINDPDRLGSPEAWVEFKEELRSSYTMEQERFLFDALIKGVAFSKALEESKSSSSEVSIDMDLF